MEITEAQQAQLQTRHRPMMPALPSEMREVRDRTLIAAAEKSIATNTPRAPALPHSAVAHVPFVSKALTAALGSARRSMSGTPRLSQSFVGEALAKALARESSRTAKPHLPQSVRR